MKTILVSLLLVTFASSANIKNTDKKPYYIKERENISDMIECLSEPTPKEKEWSLRVSKRMDFKSMEKPTYIKYELWNLFNKLNHGTELLEESVKNKDREKEKYLLILMIDELRLGLPNEGRWDEVIENCKGMELTAKSLPFISTPTSPYFYRLMLLQSEDYHNSRKKK